MTFKPLELQDCQNISKAFERGAAYSVTEESVFAMMTPLLVGIRTQSASVFKQVEAGDMTSSPKSSAEENNETQGLTGINPLGDGGSNINLDDMDKSDSNDEGFITKIQGNFFPATAPEGAYISQDGITSGFPANIAGGIFNSECIPCGERLNMLGELNPAKYLDMGKAYLQNWIVWLTQQLDMLMDLIGLFSNKDNFVDLCALLRWLNDFICIPDLQRILSVLMALMSRTSMESAGILDMILGLIGPLLVPLLSGFVDLLQSYILLIVRPIECIIESLQNIIRKLDYNVLFQNIERPDSFKSSTEPVSGSIKLPFLGTDIKYEVPGSKAKEPTEFPDPIGNAIRRQNDEDQLAIETAAAQLAAIRKSAKNIDGSDARAVEKFNADKEKATEAYRKALEKKSTSALGRVNLVTDKSLYSAKSSLFSLIALLKEAVEVVEGFFQDVFDELQKIQGAYIGGGGGFTEHLIKKMGLVQMIAFISAVIDSFANGIKCGDNNTDLKIEGFLSKDQDLKIWTDDEGVVHIQENPEDYDEALLAMIEASGYSSGMLIDTSSGLTNPKAVRDLISKDKGNSSDSRQKLKSLVEFTGNPVLDTKIARVTETLTTQVNVSFKCPLQTGLEQAEQVNKWIKELASE